MSAERVGEVDVETTAGGALEVQQELADGHVTLTGGQHERLLHHLVARRMLARRRRRRPIVLQQNVERVELAVLGGVRGGRQTVAVALVDLKLAEKVPRSYRSCVAARMRGASS